MPDLKLFEATPSVRDDTAEQIGLNLDFVDTNSFPGIPYIGPDTNAVGVTSVSSWSVSGGVFSFTHSGTGVVTLYLGNTNVQGCEFFSTDFPVCRMRIRCLARNSSPWLGRFFWQKDDWSPGSSYPWGGGNTYYFPEPANFGDGEWRDIVMDMRQVDTLGASNEDWFDKTIKAIRWDLVNTAPSGADPEFDQFEIDFIRFERGTPTAVELFQHRGEQVFGSAFDISPDPDLPTRYAETNGLETAIRLSLFSDARAQDGDELPEGSGAFGEDLRGWWGDAYLDDGGALGSRLWTLKRSKMTTETRQRARDYALEALEWLVSSGIASSIEVETSVPSRGRLDIAVTVVREGDAPARFQYLWEAF